MKTYLFKGARIQSTSIDEVLRLFGLKNTPKHRAMVIKLKKRGKE